MRTRPAIRPPSQAAGVARDAEVKLLALNHLSIRYPVATLRDEAREIFANTVLPRDFDTIEIPFAERGEPRAACAGPSGDQSTRRLQPTRRRPLITSAELSPLTRSREARKDARCRITRSRWTAMTCAARWCGSPTRSSRRTRREAGDGSGFAIVGVHRRGAVLAQRLHALTSDLTRRRDSVRHRRHQLLPRRPRPR